MPANASSEPLADDAAAPAPAALRPSVPGQLAPSPLDAAAMGTARIDPLAVGAPTAKEIGGRDGPDPTRYGDWEKNGRCIDF